MNPITAQLISEERNILNLLVDFYEDEPDNKVRKLALKTELLKKREQIRDHY